MKDGRKSYTDETSGGAEREGLGYFSSKIPTITSESEIHLSSNFITGTFPSGFTSKNLQKSHQKNDFTLSKNHKQNPKTSKRFRAVYTIGAWRRGWSNAAYTQLSSLPKSAEPFGKRGLRYQRKIIKKNKNFHEKKPWLCATVRIEERERWGLQSPGMSGAPVAALTQISTAMAIA